MHQDYKDRLCKILRTDAIKEHNLEYYYTKYPEWSREYAIKPMFDNIDIKPFEYHLPLKQLNYDNDLIQIAQEHSGSTVFKSSDELDQIMLEYLKCRSNSKLLIVWHKVIKKELFDYLSQVGCLYYVKYIPLTFDAARALLYQIYADTQKCKNLEEIEDMLINTYRYDNKNKKYITVILFDNIKNEHSELIRLSINEILKNGQKNTFFLTNKFYQTVEHGQIYFCQNSLKFLENQLLERHISYNMRKSRILLATFKKWVDQNMTLEQRRGILLFSSIILYIYGIRNIKDIDVYLDDNIYSKTLDNYLLNDEKKFYFIDSTMPNSKNWKLYWNKWQTKWAQLMGAKSFHEVIYNPKYHFYYMGMKFMILKGDIERRLIRQRPRSMVDLIKINELLNMNIQIPMIPKTKMQYIRIEEGFAVPELKENQSYNSENREIEEIVPIDIEYYLGTMQWYFKTMYYENRSIEDIKSHVGVKKIKVKLSKMTSITNTSQKTIIKKIKIKKL